METNTLLSLGLKLAEDNTPNATYCCIVDMSRDADHHRLFLINVKAKSIEYHWYTTHGSGSGPLEKCENFSNISMSRKTSKGLMKTGSEYIGKHGRSMKLKGLEKGINSNVENRSIVMHPSNYVSSQYMLVNQYPGRSWGCICLDPIKSDEIIDKLKDGSIVYVIGN